MSAFFKTARLHPGGVHTARKGLADAAADHGVASLGSSPPSRSMRASPARAAAGEMSSRTQNPWTIPGWGRCVAFAPCAERCSTRATPSSWSGSCSAVITRVGARPSRSAWPPDRGARVPGGTQRRPQLRRRPRRSSGIPDRASRGRRRRSRRHGRRSRQGGGRGRAGRPGRPDRCLPAGDGHAPLALTGPGPGPGGGAAIRHREPRVAPSAPGPPTAPAPDQRGRPGVLLSPRGRR